MLCACDSPALRQTKRGAEVRTPRACKDAETAGLERGVGTLRASTGDQVPLVQAIGRRSPESHSSAHAQKTVDGVRMARTAEREDPRGERPL